MRLNRRQRELIERKLAQRDRLVRQLRRVDGWLEEMGADVLDVKMALSRQLSAVSGNKLARS